MRILRAKSVRKHLQFYRIVYGIQSPYKVILDGNFIHWALKYKIDIVARLNGTLQQTDCEIYVLSSVLDELRRIGAAVEAAASYASSQCTLIDDSAFSGTPAERLIQFLGSSTEKYFVATQDVELRHQLRGLPGVPVLYFNKVSLVFEPPSRASQKKHTEVERVKVGLSATEEKMVEVVNKSTKQDHSEHEKKEEAPPTYRQKRKAKAPNPLASKKAKADSKKQIESRKKRFRSS